MSPSGTKECPFCAETIKMAAVLCRFCGRELPPLGSPEPPAPVVTFALTNQPAAAPLVIRQSEVFDLLNALVEKSLVVYEADEQGNGRYRLLETVRQYARDRLQES